MQLPPEFALQAKDRQRQEERWAARTGPVEISHVPAEDVEEEAAEDLEQDPDCE